MPLSLSEADYRPIEQFAFQRWGGRRGSPYQEIRPLSAGAAERVWRRTLQLAAVGEAGTLAGDLFDRQARLDLSASSDWDEAAVRAWLLEQVPRRDQLSLIAYGPPWAVAVPWGTFCDHWLTFCWPEACCVWPVTEEWLVRHDRDHFVAGWRRSPVP